MKFLKISLVWHLKNLRTFKHSRIYEQYVYILKFPPKSESGIPDKNFHEHLNNF